MKEIKSVNILSGGGGEPLNSKIKRTRKRTRQKWKLLRLRFYNGRNPIIAHDNRRSSGYNVAELDGKH